MEVNMVSKGDEVKRGHSRCRSEEHQSPQRHKRLAGSRAYPADSM